MTTGASRGLAFLVPSQRWSRPRLVAAKAVSEIRRFYVKLTGPTASERMLIRIDTHLARQGRSLVGKRVLVTGSTRGIGRALAIGFARSGATVIVHGRCDADARKVAEAVTKESGVEALGLAADLSIADAGRSLVERAVACVGGLEIVVNNAAIHDARRKPLWDTSTREMCELFRVNVVAPFEIATAAIAKMLEQRVAGRVINISSRAADPAGPAPGVASYGISKVALEGLSSYLAAETRDVTIVTLRPGAIDTDLVKPLFAWDERCLMLRPDSLVAPALYLATAPGEQVHGKVFDQADLLRTLSTQPEALALAV